VLVEDPCFVKGVAPRVEVIVVHEMAIFTVRVHISGGGNATEFICETTELGEEIFIRDFWTSWWEWVDADGFERVRPGSEPASVKLRAVFSVLLHVLPSRGATELVGESEEFEFEFRGLGNAISWFESSFIESIRPGPEPV